MADRRDDRPQEQLTRTGRWDSNLPHGGLIGLGEVNLLSLHSMSPWVQSTGEHPLGRPPVRQ